MNPLERRIKDLVRRAKGVLVDGDTGNLPKVYERLGLSASQVMSSGVAARHLYERIRTSMEWNDKATAVRLDDLERHLVLRHLADGAPC